MSRRTPTETSCSRKSATTSRSPRRGPRPCWATARSRSIRSDERYAPIVGKLCEIPVGPKEHRRLIPIITDEYPDPEFGSGAVKITGAHDFNDYQVAKPQRHSAYRLMDTKAAMRADGEAYAVCAAQALAIAKGGDCPARRRSTTSTWCPTNIAASTASTRASGSSSDQRRGPSRYRDGRGRQRACRSSRTRRSCSHSATARASSSSRC